GNMCSAHATPPPRARAPSSISNEWFAYSSGNTDRVASTCGADGTEPAELPIVRESARAGAAPWAGRSRRKMSCMSPSPFVHRRLHSEYSVTDGIVRIDEAIAAAAGDRMPALALTDLANVFGMVKFYQTARARGVKPIIGCDVWIENESDRDKP